MLQPVKHLFEDLFVLFDDNESATEFTSSKRCRPRTRKRVNDPLTRLGVDFNGNLDDTLGFLSIMDLPAHHLGHVSPDIGSPVVLALCWVFRVVPSVTPLLLEKRDVEAPGFLDVKPIDEVSTLFSGEKVVVLDTISTFLFPRDQVC